MINYKILFNYLFQALIIMAWHDKSLYQFFNDAIFEDASSIFVTSSFLRLVQGNVSSNSHDPLDFSPSFLGKYLIELCN